MAQGTAAWQWCRSPKDEKVRVGASIPFVRAKPGRQGYAAGANRHGINKDRTNKDRTNKDRTNKDRSQLWYEAVK